MEQSDNDKSIAERGKAISLAVFELEKTEKSEDGFWELQATKIAGKETPRISPRVSGPRQKRGVIAHSQSQQPCYQHVTRHVL